MLSWSVPRQAWVPKGLMLTDKHFKDFIDKLAAGFSRRPFFAGGLFFV